MKYKKTKIWISVGVLSSLIMVSLPPIMMSCSYSNPSTTKPTTKHNYFIVREKLVGKERVFGIETTLSIKDLRNKINKALEENNNSFFNIDFYTQIIRLQTEKELQSFKANPQEELKNNNEYIGAPILNKLIEIEGESLPMN